MWEGTISGVRLHACPDAPALASTRLNTRWPPGGFAPALPWSCAAPAPPLHLPPAAAAETAALLRVSLAAVVPTSCSFQVMPELLFTTWHSLLPTRTSCARIVPCSRRCRCCPNALPAVPPLPLLLLLPLVGCCQTLALPGTALTTPFPLTPAVAPGTAPGAPGTVPAPQSPLAAAAEALAA